MSVSFRVFLTSVSPPTSSQPSSPAWWSGTFLMDAGVNPFMASSKSACVRIISGWGLSADCSGLLSNKQIGKWKQTSVTTVKPTYKELIFTKSGICVYSLLWVDSGSLMLWGWRNSDDQKIWLYGLVKSFKFYNIWPKRMF